MTWRDRVRAVRMDVTPLRTSRDFRLLFVAGTVFYFGGMITYVAIPYQLYTITGSNAAVGLVGLVELLPLLVGGLYGGALADHVDRRKLLVATGVAQAVITALLAVNAFQERPDVWPIYVLAFLPRRVRPACSARPARRCCHGRWPHDELVAANALGSFGMQVGLLSGPAIGGLLLAHAGVGLVLRRRRRGARRRHGAVRRDAPLPAPGRDDAAEPGGDRRGDPLRRSPGSDLLGTYLVDIAAMLLAIPVVLFPALAEDIFRQTGAARAALHRRDVGAMIATATSGWASRVHHHGRAIVIAAACYGLFIGLVGLAPTIWVGDGRCSRSPAPRT